MIKKILTLLFAFAAIQLTAQQEAQFSQYMFSHTNYNPGALGINDAICANGLHRQQWMGLEGAEGTGSAGTSINPVTTFFSLDAPIHPIYGGVGLNFKQDEIGPFKNTTVELGYSYHHNIGPGKLGVGIMAGMIDYSVDFTHFEPRQKNDPLLQGAKESAMVFDMKFGGYYKVPGEWYAGFSTSRIIQNEVTLPKNLAKPDLKRHYYLTGGYMIDLPHPDFSLEPSALIKSDFATTQYDISTLAWYRKQFYGGLTYRPNDAVAVLVGMKNPLSGISSSEGTFQYEGSMLGISYDVTTSPLGAEGRSAGSFEVYLRYCFNIEIPKTLEGHETVRFL